MAKKLIQNPEEIRLTEQHEIEAIMGNPPGRLLTSGNYLLLGGISVLLALGFLLPYPDVVEARVQIISDAPPIRLVPRQSGRLIYLPKTDNAAVQEGELLAVIDNPAEWKDVVKMENYFLGKLKQQRIKELPTNDLPSNLNLGALQNPYAVFVNNLETANFNTKNDRTQAQLANFDLQIKNFENSNFALSEREKTAAKELVLFDTIVQRNRAAKDNGLISQEAFEKILIEKNQTAQRIKTIENQKLENEVAINQLEKQKIDLQQRTRLSQNEYDLKTVAAYENLKGAIEQWKKNYLLYAPLAGKISYTNLLTINQFVQTGSAIMTIIPTYQSVTGRAQLGQKNIGKISLQDSVKIQLAGFPYYDYGVIAGKVNKISSLPENDFYTIEIVFPKDNLTTQHDSLKILTSYQKSIPIRQEMEGTARIITEENTYLGRIFNKLRSTFD